MSQVDSRNYRVGEFIRRSSKTRSWEKAQKLVSKLEIPRKRRRLLYQNRLSPNPDFNRTTIEVAVETFLNDANSRGLQEPTQQKLRYLCGRQLLDWAKTESLVHLMTYHSRSHKIP